MEHIGYLNTLPFHFTLKRLSFLRDVSLLIAIAINIIMLLYYDVSLNSKKNVRINTFIDKIQKRDSKDYIYFLGII